VAEWIVVAGATGVGIPLVLGLIRMSKRLGLDLALRAMPEAAEGKVDIAAAPRRALVVTLQLTIVLCVGLPLLVLTTPYVPDLRLELLFALLLVVLGIAFWRSATDLLGHAHAGAEVIVGALARQMVTADEHPERVERTMEKVQWVLPGLGEPIPMRVRTSSSAAGKTLAELNMRGLTGATVLAIMRKGKNSEQVLAPSGKHIVHGGDLLAVAGTKEAVEAARALLEQESPSTL
jgi:CPA2 family monovalent cation:H+ antiporter-2